MRLKAGLLAPSPGWETLLRQEGFPWEVLTAGDSPITSSYSILIINRMPTPSEDVLIRRYLKDGGAIVGYAGFMDSLTGIDSALARIDYLFSDHDQLFPEVSLIDLAMQGRIPREAHYLRTHALTFALFAGEAAGGYAVLLPFDVEIALRDTRIASKNFYFTRDRLPSEKVSLVGKGEIRQLIRKAIEYLHAVRGLPYAHLWYFPAGRRNLFALRVDTDRGSRNDIDALYGLAREHDVGLSWYLDVKSHEPWLRHFTSMVGQEIGLHCYEHQVYPTYEDNARNISRAMRLMEEAGMHPSGFSAPRGIWNPSLARVLEEFRFPYSSEFTYAYDTFPLYPIHDGRFLPTPQIPIHPICVGSMKRAGYPESLMREYFERIITQKLIRHEPLFFYHHPLDGCSEVVRFLFDRMNENGVEDTTLGEYARWWETRIAAGVDIQTEGKELRLTIRNPAEGSECAIRCRLPSGKEAIVPVRTTIDLNAVDSWNDPLPYHAPDDMTRIREFDPRAMLANLYSSMTRKLR